jgi:hypothetical protein
VTVLQVVLWVAVAVALGALYLWVRDLGVAGDSRGWPVLSAGHEYRGGGRDFDTLALADRLERAEADPTLAERLAADLHRQLVTVVESRLAMRLPAPDEGVLVRQGEREGDPVRASDPVGPGDRVRHSDRESDRMVDELRRFSQARPDPAVLTTRAGLDSLLSRIEKL